MGLFRVVMASFSSIVMYDIPVIMVIASFILGYVETVILCLILAVVFEKFVRSKHYVSRYP